MIHNIDNPASISYVSVSSDPERDIEVMDEDDMKLRRYCNGLEIAVLVSEVVAVISIALCAFVI